MKFLTYRVTHTTLYRYTPSVAVSHHLLWLRPRNLPSQRCLDYSLTVEPTPETEASHFDYFGNHCSFVTVAGSHDALTVTAASRVAVAPQFAPDPQESPPWERARSLVLTDRSRGGIEALEFTYESPLIHANKDIARFAQTSFTPNRPLLEAALELTGRIFTEFKFDPTATDVSTPLGEMFAARRGVCQDFAHLQIACFRSLGIPARYVSGYLETDPPPGSVKLVGSDASHAWVSFFCPGMGWIDLDPTNGCMPTLRHITVGWARDYADVSPLRGVIHGGANHVLEVSVDVAAEGPVELSSLDLEENQPPESGQTRSQTQTQTQTQISPAPGDMTQSMSQQSQ